jgi:hypothetical protein
MCKTKRIDLSNQGLIFLLGSYLICLPISSSHDKQSNSSAAASASTRVR